MTRRKTCIVTTRNSPLPGADWVTRAFVAALGLATVATLVVAWK